MNVFDIIGPVMVGPSSSHTAGAVRIGKVARDLLGEEPEEVKIVLYGSFARTYRGHGTDKAIVAGLMGMNPDDERIPQSLSLAAEAGMRFEFESTEQEGEHPNTAVIRAVSRTGKAVTVKASSVGGGNIVIQEIDGQKVEFTGQYHTLVISHQDTPGVVASVASLLAGFQINIASMKVFRSYPGGWAIMVIETDQEIGMELETMIRSLPKVQSSRWVRTI